MLKFVGKRLLVMIPILLAVTLLIFSILSLLPGDVAIVMLGDNATPETIATWNEEHDMNSPFLLRYWHYIKNFVRGDFGNSWRTGTPVAKEFFQRFPTTLIFALGIVVINTLIASTVGIISAVKQYSIFDYAVVVLAMIFTAMPTFWIALLMILLFSLKLGWFPVTGGGSFHGFVLPWVAMAISGMASIARMTRSSMLDVIHSDYVQTARAKGCSPMRVVFNHELRNALLPMITMVGLILGASLSGTIIGETVFAIPGIGTYLLTGIRSYDMPVVVTCVFFIAAIISLVNLAVDILYMVVDPRLRSRFVKTKK